MEGPGFVIGNVAKGKDFWGRQKEIADIWRAIKTTSILLKAPRRFGKTSIMNHLYENSDSGFKVVFIDVEGMRDPIDFIALLTTELIESEIFKNNYWDWIKKKLPSVEEINLGISGDMGTGADLRIKIRENIGKDWQKQDLELISRIKDYKGKLLIILDELPILAQNILRKDGKETAYDFLLWFRSIRQSLKLSNVRWLMGGSIGIEHILDKIGAGTKVINDLQIIRVEPFSNTEGKNFVKALIKTESKVSRIKDSVIDTIIETIGAPVPYFLQILVYESINEMQRLGRKSLDNEMIHSAYKKGVLGPASRTYFEHYYTRLKDYYDEDIEHVAKKLILEVARKQRVKKTELLKLFNMESKGKLSDEAFSYLMNDIENDFYVSYDEKNKSYGFTTNVLRDWWLRYYDLVEE